MKQILKYISNKVGYNISRIKPVGENPFIDMRKYLHNDNPIIFDVGANTGQSVIKFRREFPTAIIHSFEPSPKTFEQLEQQTSEFDNLHLWNFALGSSVGQMKFLDNSHPNMSSFLPPGEFG